MKTRTPHLLPIWGVNLDHRLAPIAMLFAESDRPSNLTVIRCAKALGVQPDRFRSEFRRITGHKFRAFAVALRLLRAAQLLRNTDMPIKAVAWEAGYERCCDLDHRFKPAFGETPREFREHFRPRAWTLGGADFGKAD